MIEPDDKNADIDAVIRKIKKLLTRTKGDRGATEEESDTAMRIVQELLVKYNLDMATIDAAGVEDVGSVRVDERSAARTRFKWQRELAQYVAEANFCLYVLQNERKRDAEGNLVWGSDGRRVRHLVHRFIGRKANVITTQIMFDYLCHTIEDNVPLLGKWERFSRSSSSWKEGCAAKICERLAKRREDLMAEHDARVKAEQKAWDEDQERRARVAKDKAARVLGPRPSTIDEIAEGMRKGACVATGLKSEAPLDEPDRPEINKDDWVPGAGSEPEPEEAPPVTTLVLASVYDQREQELNEDLRWGKEPGTTTKRRLEREARYAREAEEEAAREKEEAKEPEAPAPIETERQRERRLKREEKEHEKWRRRWARDDDRQWRKEMKEHARRDHDAYRSGMKTGEKIGLDPQVKARADAKRLGK